MYKVFFNDRKVILTDNFSKHFLIKYGLFYKYRDEEDLKELIWLYQRLKSIDSLYIFHSDIDELREYFRKCFIPLDAAGGLVKNNKGEFLLIYRRGKWDLPKGKLDPGESLEQAAVREVSEECGLDDLQLIRPLMSTYHTYDYKQGIALKKTTWFEMTYTGNSDPTPESQEGIKEAKWVPEEQLKPYLDNTYPAIRDVMTYFGV